MSRTEAGLQSIIGEIAGLLERHRVLEGLAHRQDTPNRAIVEELQHRQNLVELQRQIRRLHPSDLAHVLESLPLDQRLQVWREADVRQAAEALVELDPVVGHAMIAATDRRRLKAVVCELDLDDLAYLSDAVPDDTFREVVRSLGDADQSLLQQTIAYPEGSVGHLMTREVAAVRETQTIGNAIADIRRRGALPPHSDRLFVVDARNILRGSVGLQALLFADPAATIATVMEPDPVSFSPDDEATQAANAFERYDLLSAPVVNDRGKLVGRITVDAIVDFVRARADSDALAMAGLRRAEDLFASVWASARNRSPWLLVNLVTAFLATRFIGLFETTIQEFVALATLMPIVASVGGNTGNQTVALVIRGLAFDQLSPASLRQVMRKELIVSVINGLMWGSLVGLFAGLLYRHLRLGLVMAAAVLLNLVIAAAVGVFVPLTLERMHRDPAQGASVLLTFITDSMGFFIFLGLARLFL